MCLPSSLVRLIEHLVEDNLGFWINTLHAKALNNMLLLKLGLFLKLIAVVPNNIVLLNITDIAALL